MFFSNALKGFKVYSSKMSVHDSGLDSTSFETMHGSDHHGNSFGHQSKSYRFLPNNDNPIPGQDSSLATNDFSSGENSVYHGTRLRKMRDK